MCLIIDANCIARVFDANNDDHEDFKKVLEWITEGCGKMIYGGKTYKEELAKLTKFLPLLKELHTKRKLILLDDALVDQAEDCAKKKEDDKDFDDPHLVAIVVISRCQVVCSKDKRAYRFLKMKKFYPNKLKPPRIYSKRSNTNLLSKRYIVGECKK